MQPASTPAPVTITRFQVALNVASSPPSVTDVEFKPTELVPRYRHEPRIISDAPAQPGEEGADPRPAVIIDRPGAGDTLPSFPPMLAGPPSGPTAMELAVTAPTPATLEIAVTAPTATTLELAAFDPGPGAGVRTPGSTLVLPANPLHDLSDESLEGFIDCTLYEESGNVFHPGWDEQAGEPAPAPAPPSQAAPRASVPAMPFDAAPEVMVRSAGETESLAVSAEADLVRPARAGAQLPGWQDPQDPLAAVPVAQPWNQQPDYAPMPAPWGAAVGYPAQPSELSQASVALPVQPALGGPHAQIDERVAPPSPVRGALYPPPSGIVAGLLVVPDEPPASAAAGWSEPERAPYGHGAALFGPGDPATVVALPGYGDPRGFAAESAGVPGSLTARPAIDWRRLALITGTAVVSIVLAFVIAWQVRGKPPAAAPATPVTPAPATPASGKAEAPTTASPPTGKAEPPAAAPPSPPAKTEAPATPAPAGTAQTPPASAATAPAVGAAARLDSAAPANHAVAADRAPADEDDGEAADGAPSAGAGPCRLTVATTPAGSLVRLDDQPMGPSPITLDASCARHRVDVSHARYQVATRWVTLVEGRPAQLEVALTRPTHAVTVTSFPPGAELSIDGRRAGTTPAVIQMMGFATVNLTFRKPGFQSVTMKVYSRQAQDRVFVKLTQ